MVKSILKVLKKNQIHLKKAVVCVVAMALILQSLVYYGQNYTLDAKATENQRGNMTATTSGDAKTIPLNSSGTDSLKGDGLVTDSSQGDSSGTDSPKGDGLVEDSPQENDMETDSSQGDSPRTDSLKEDGLLADSPQENDLEIDLSQDDSSGTDSSTGTAEGSATENSTGTGNDSVENQDATTSGDAKADDSETDATPEDDSDGKLDNLMAEITNSLLEMAAFNVNSNYVYLNPTGMTLGGINWSTVSNVYITATGWSTPAAGTKDANGYWYWDVSSFGSTSNTFCFTLSNNWSTIKSYDYYRTDMSTISLASAKGKIFTHDGTAAKKIDSKYVYAIKEFTSLEGQTINFVDCTQSHSEVTAIFSDDNTFASSATTYKEIEVTSSTNVFSFTIPGEQKYVKFEDAKGNQLGDAYNFYGQASTGEHGIMFVEGTTDTYYYKVTEKANDDSISTWGALPPNKKLKNTTLYFDITDFAEKPTFIVDGTTVELKDSVNGKWVYNFPKNSTATQRTVLTVLKDGVKYHFLWSDIVNSNVVKIQSDIANVTGKYIPAREVYFDATLSKLDYIDAQDSSIGSGNVWCYVTKSGSDTDTLDPKQMTKLEPYTDGTNTWKDVYVVDLEEGYDRIVFANYDSISTTNYGAFGDSTTALDIPAALTNPCFYADTGDQSVYDTQTLGGRGGYWDEVYTIHDAEAGKSTTGSTVDVVDIKKSTFTRDAQTLYINSTFYDYYTDYELNGYNRDTYPYAPNADKLGGPFPSQRNWVTFRQFNQALSDYDKGESVSIPIYTGHFQTDGGDTFPFTDVANSLNLFGFGTEELKLKGRTEYNAAYNKFFSTNNSVIDIEGNTKYGEEPLYDYTAQKLVNDELDTDGSLLMKETDNTKKIKEPHFDEDFLTGNNSKNTVLGEVYHNVSFPFTQKERTDANGNGLGIKYWSFNSAETTLAMRQDTDTDAYYLHQFDTRQPWAGNVNSGSNQYGVAATYGFFPFNEGSKVTNLGETATTENGIQANTYNYGYGAKLEFNFKLTEDGRVEGNDEKRHPITFKFSGDDDVWVFIDGKLVLDIGGAHGVVTGEINFADGAPEDPAKWPITATVSKVKKSAGNEESAKYGTGNADYGTNITKTAYLEGTTATEHKLTMFYMERGMWESNMSIEFNFPDENQLEVEKQVDTTDVNDLFKPLFDNVSLFEMNIKNLATHYGPHELGVSEQPTKTTFNNEFNKNTVQPATGNIFKREESKEDQEGVVRWWAAGNDVNPPGKWRANRYGIISANNDAGYVDISKMSYLEFKYYYDYNDTPTLDSMYLQLVDTEENIKGNVTDFLAGKTYGMVSMAGKKWVTVKIDLSALKEYVKSSDTEQDVTFTEKAGSFNNRVAQIKFGYNYPRNIYLDDFIFYPVATVSETAGFTVKQYNIPDYGSASTGELKIPVGAVYSSNAGINRVIGEDGTFYLKNGETVTFKDQFRRGSYIYLAETANSLFETSWTMYENGRAVEKYGDNTVESDGSPKVEYASPFNDVESQKLIGVRGQTVNDGRIEPYITGHDGDNMSIANNGYTAAAKPTTDTFVFRSYAYPNNSAMLIKLKVVYTNKVKVGSLKITKKKKYENEELSDSYKFKVTFSNIGGISLGDGAREMEVEVKAGESVTIDGIPLNTIYTVEEITPTDGSSLDSVKISDSTSMMVDPSTNIVQGVILKQTGEANIPNITFTNTKEPKISASMTKVWIDEVTDAPLVSGLPASITVQLQRKEKGASDDTYEAVEKYKSITVEPSTDDEGNPVWQYSVSGLDKVVDYPDLTKTWEYRFVEVKKVEVETTDEDENVTTETQVQVIPNGTVITLPNTKNENDDYQVTYGEPSMDSKTGNYSNTITNTRLGANLHITKKSSNTTNGRLAGVTFKLEQLVTTQDGDGDPKSWEDTTSDVSSDGKTGGDVTFSKLADGTYRLTETKTAKGHTLLKEPIIITIDRKSNTYTWKMESEKSAQDLGEDSWNSDTRTLSITITNSTNIQLPFTGGYSPIPIMAGGMALSMAASLLYINKKKRRRKEGKPPGT